MSSLTWLVKSSMLSSIDLLQFQSECVANSQELRKETFCSTMTHAVQVIGYRYHAVALPHFQK